MEALLQLYSLPNRRNPNLFHIGSKKHYVLRGICPPHRCGIHGVYGSSNFKEIQTTIWHHFQPVCAPLLFKKYLLSLKVIVFGWYYSLLVIIILTWTEMELWFLEEQIQHWNYPTLLRSVFKFKLMRQHQPIWNPHSHDENDIGLDTVINGELSNNEGRMFQVNIIQLKGKAQKQELTYAI